MEGIEGLHDNYTSSNPPADIIQKSVSTQNNMDPSFISLSFITDDDILEEFSTVNETILNDYSQTNDEASSSSNQNKVTELVTSMNDSPAMDLLNSQMSSAPDSNFNVSKPSPSTPSNDAETLEDEDVLPPSPVPAGAHPRRTPANLSRSSAFVTMAIGSPVQGSLRTLRNIEEAASSSAVQDKSCETTVGTNEATAKTVVNTDASGNPSKSKSMRQIRFESDSGSNQSVIESPSSFVSEPGRSFDDSIQKPTVSRPTNLSEVADDGIEFIEEINNKICQDSSSPPNSIAIPAGQPPREVDLASQDLTPRLNPSPPSFPYSQDLLSTSPFRDPDSQSHRFVECFQTQDLVTRADIIADETIDHQADMTQEITSPKLELSVELCTDQALSDNHDFTKNNHSTPAVIPVDSSIEPKSEENDLKGSNDTTQHISSQEDTPESETDQWVPFEAVTRVYNSLDRSWTIRTFNKMLPMSKFEVASSGSVADQVQMGLFDNMDSETLSGSRLESFAELLHRHVSQSSSGYSADVSGSFKSDSASLRVSRLSIASTFESAPIACSSMLSRASLEPPHLPSTSEFAVPRHPVRQKMPRGANGELAKPSSPSTQSKEDASAPLPSHSPPDPDSTECAITSDPKQTSTSKSGDSPSNGKETESPAFTALKPGRKRGRKPKIPEAIKESDSSTDTPPKKNRRGRPPGNGTPAKGRASSSKSNQESEQPNPDNPSNADSPTEEENLNLLTREAGNEKSSEDYLKEAEEAWRDLRNQSFEIDKLVFAQWPDKFYYAGKIFKRDPVQNGKWTVLFEDGRTRSLVEEFILPVSLLPKNQPVVVLNENLGEGRPGIVIGYSKNKSSGQVDHLVEMDGCETMKVPRIRICLRQEQMRLWSDAIVVQQLFSPHTCNVSLDNILGGKRRRATTAELVISSPHKTPATRSPRTPRARSEAPAVVGNATPKRSLASPGSLRKKLKGKRDVVLDTSTMSESSGASMLQHEETSLRTRIIDRMNSALSGQQEIQSIVEEEKNADGETKEEVDIRIAGPIPENKQLFLGFSFILTKASRPLEVDPDDITDDLEPYMDPTPYYKEYIRRQLLAGGGKVLERFELSCLQPDDETVLLVSNRPCRTERYIRAIAANIRAVSHDWVYQCCQKNERFNYQRYLQPPGIDLRGNIVEWSSTTGRCFVGTRILLNGPPQFNDLWIPILVQAECIIVSRLPARLSKNSHEGANGETPETEKALCDDVPFDYVVTTKDCPAKIVDQARRMKIPLVSSLWIVQSLIHGKILDPSSNPEFNFNFTKP